MDEVTGLCRECRSDAPEKTGQNHNIVSESRSNKTHFAPSIHRQGKNLEEMVEAVLKSEGYSTQKRRRIQGVSGTKNEIDVWAEKMGKILLAECKNYNQKNQVGISELTHFKTKIDEISKMHNTKIDGLFVTSSYFSGEAEKFALHHHIELWDYSALSDRFMKIQLGRSEDQAKLELALPLEISYDDVLLLRLINQDLVAVKKVSLFWHPYYRIDYRLDMARKLPNKKIHTENIEDFILFDAVNNESVSKSSARQHIRDQFRRSKSRSHYRVEIDDRYHTSILQPKGAAAMVKKLANRHIIERHSRPVEYQVKFEDDYITRSIKIVPVPKEIIIKDMQLIYAPVWNVVFELGDEEYYRISYGKPNEFYRDDISICAKNHGLWDKIRMYPKESHAICETCYKPFCEKHIVSASSRYYCKEHDPTPKDAKKKSGFSLFR